MNKSSAYILRGIAAACLITGVAKSSFADITVTGYGHYCSMTWPGGGWAFTSDTNGNDPCGYIKSHSDPGGTIQRAGIYHATGMNIVVARCTDNSVWLFGGVGNGPLTAAYDKAKGRPGCIAGYFHLKKRANLAVGQTVTAGTYLGDIGWVGCSSQAHLHFAVIRTTNVAQYKVAPFHVPQNNTDPNNGWHWAIDPYGFLPPKNIDPWGWRGYPDGALSINLWKSGEAPPLGTWGP